MVRFINVVAISSIIAGVCFGQITDDDQKRINDAKKQFWDLPAKQTERPIEKESKAGNTQFPKIGGEWSIDIDVGRQVMTVDQKGEKFTATCIYQHPTEGEIRWTITGTITNEGNIIGKLKYTKAPKSWQNQTYIAALTPDGKTIKGRAVTYGGGGHDYVWARSDVEPAAEPIRAPDEATKQRFAGRWRIADSIFTLSGSLTATKSHAPKVTGKWEIVGDEARITWSDGWKDVIRPQKKGFQKVAFGPGTSWEDKPANTQVATKETEVDDNKLVGVAGGVQKPLLDSPSLGVTLIAIADLPVEIKKDLDLPTKIGVALLTVEPNSPAANAKLRPLDLITNINKKAIHTEAQYNEVMEGLEIGKEYEVKGFRGQSVGKKMKWKGGSIKLTPVNRRDVYLNAMRKKLDEVRETTSYRHVDSPESVNTASDLFLYFIAKKAEKPLLHLRIQFVNDDWLFIRRYVVKADENTFTIKPDRLQDVERDNGDGKVWEWHDHSVGADERKMIDAITAAKRVILRCESDKYFKDRDLSRDEIHRLRVVLEAYRIMGGE